MVVGGPGPLTGRVSTGIPWNVGRAVSGSATLAIATRPRGGTSSIGASSVAVGSFTGSAVSITDGGPARERRDRLSGTLSEAAEDLGGLGMSTSGRRKRMRTGTWTISDGRDLSLSRWIIKRCNAGFRNIMTEFRSRAWYIPNPGSVNVVNRSADNHVVCSSCCRTESRITS